MSVASDRAVTRESVRHWSRAVVGMEVADGDLDAILLLLTMVLGETALVTEFNRTAEGPGCEPSLRFALEDWRP